MGEFKPMVKMETTEPSIELKLKKGGSVGHKAMKKGGKADATGHKMMDGGLPATIGAPRGGLAPAVAPKRPSLAARRRAAAPVLKTGGVVKGQGGYKTGGVVKGQGGYKDGGIIKSETGKTKVVTTSPDRSPAKTGDVKLGNGGGYCKGGATKKFASGGSVNDSGRAQRMPQGEKTPSSPVSISKLSGTFKKGGNVSSKKLQKAFKAENAPAVKAAKADTDLKYSKYQKSGKKMADGGASYDESFESPREQLSRMRLRKDIERGIGATSDIEREANESLLKSLTNIPSKLKDMFKGQGAVTDKEREISRTVTPPAKKHGGKVKK